MWNRIFKIFILLYIPFLFLTMLWAYSQRKEQIERLSEIELRNAEQKRVFLLDLCQNMIYYTSYWSSIVGVDTVGELPEKPIVMQSYLNTMNGFTDYDQFRLLNLQGKEVVRYERNTHGDLKKGDLQDKSERNYFKDGMKLKKGEIYLSAINLNREYGQIEYPYKPVMRGVRPIFDSLGNRLGIVVINYNMTRILAQLKDQITNSDFYLVDSHLNIITSNKGQTDLAFELGKKDNTGTYKLENEALKTFTDTTFIDSGSIWAFKKVVLSDIFKEGIHSRFPTKPRLITATNWGIVSHINSEQLLKYLEPVYINLAVFNFFAILTFLTIAYFSVRKQLQKKEFYEQLEAKNKALLEGEKQLKLANAQLNTVNNSLQKRNQQLEEFNYVVSHNLRAPVTSMTLIVDMIGEAKDIEEIKMLLPKLEQINNNITHLTEDIRTYITILNRNEIDIEEIGLKAIIRAVASDFTETFDEKKSIEVVCNLEVWDRLTFSYFYLKSILQNFISNAIKYRRANVDSYIKFETAFENGQKVLYVSDNGIGINLERHKRNVFKLYKRFHRNISGKGMGLFLIKSELEALDANIAIESEVDSGTIFKIIFKDL